MKMRRLILFSVTVICLVGILYSFKLIKLSPPQQERSKLTGSPVWHGEIENFDQQILNSGTLVPIMLIFCSTIISIIFSYKKSKSKAYISYFIFPDYPTTLKNNPSNITTRSFNKKFNIGFYTRDLIQQKPVLPSHSDDQEENTANKKLKFITHPNQVLLLPLAALVHVFGIIASYVLINNIIGYKYSILSINRDLVFNIFFLHLFRYSLYNKYLQFQKYCIALYSYLEIDNYILVVYYPFCCYDKNYHT
uniref:Uncharacterized protein n=1 Tax=Rhizophagus irregularis (strain DAOM 181602 / DAOM 197198 / MUCL 43194) TaxID=747089 RepID=U9V119_RHIID